MNKFSFLRYEKELKEDTKSTSTTTTISTLVPPKVIFDSKRYSLANEAVFRTLLIAKNPKICQGKPVILGTRISVTNIVELYYLLGWDIKKIRDEYPHLNTQQIIAAIEYYENHTKEIDSYLQEEKEVNA